MDLLRQQLMAFSVDDDTAPMSFIKRLAKEQGWGLPFARRAFKEYKRFLYLAATGDRLSVPSDIIDSV